ncbi:MAG: ABC transporter permease [Anaerolineales bacterium]|nr:ABC transporter permease [Anaerolineales bacterium]MCB0028355.1 ABC transporter permease [Anaerolineales bacterium]
MSVPLAKHNLLHERGKLIISLASIAAAIALTLLLLGFKAGLYSTLTAFIDHAGADIIVAQSGVEGLFTSNSSLPLAIHDELANAVGATEAGHIAVADIIFTYGDTKTPVLLVGFDPNTPFGQPWKIGEGRSVRADDEILLDSWLAQKAGVTVGDEVSVLDRRFRVVGLTQETASWMSPYIFVSLDAATAALRLNQTVSYHLLRLPSEVDIPAAVASIQQQVPGVEALTPDDIADADSRVLATIMDTPLNVMIVIGVVIGAAVMGLTAYTSVTDRMREYGVLMAIGAGGGRLAWLATVETLYRAVLAYLLGAAFAYLAAWLIMANWPQFSIVIQPVTLGSAAFLTLIMTGLAALFPIYRIKGIDPALVFR